jgi:hypothetical protein
MILYMDGAGPNAIRQPGKRDNFRGAPDLSRISFSGGPDIKGTYKKCRNIKRNFKMQQSLLKIRN